VAYQSVRGKLHHKRASVCPLRDHSCDLPGSDLAAPGDSLSGRWTKFW